MPVDSGESLSISFMDVKEAFPYIDPERLIPSDVLDILLREFHQIQGFVDFGHEANNRETAWVNGYLYRQKTMVWKALTSRTLAQVSTRRPHCVNSTNADQRQGG